MKTRSITKPEKVALCRECHGRGTVSKLGFSRLCPNCEGSGRVLVSCEMTLHVRPYKVH
ncbi:molecular chaperone DnaJ [Pseudoprevotella muciniphila]|uniref:Molecular chaperone DnaJ n=1 Tax=Pseudoprevotella muciniphila TaxID=2133944 RepID=A0A5P8E7Y4_9BACT|nr:molecular chaperone DnaJ [Pseudoprevotella muciniphila]QFQ11556.1 molecular chaperone DnaJ [Pseudoprevotella muciniphila]QFQ13083.1 molecular chaperone DnaJ [Pseudoprevotella muciniphila]